MNNAFVNTNGFPGDNASIPVHHYPLGKPSLGAVKSVHNLFGLRVIVKNQLKSFCHLFYT